MNGNITYIILITFTTICLSITVHTQAAFADKNPYARRPSRDEVINYVSTTYGVSKEVLGDYIKDKPNLLGKLSDGFTILSITEQIRNDDNKGAALTLLQAASMKLLEKEAPKVAGILGTSMTAISAYTTSVQVLHDYVWMPAIEDEVYTVYKQKRDFNLDPATAIAEIPYFTNVYSGEIQKEMEKHMTGTKARGETFARLIEKLTIAKLEERYNQELAIKQLEETREQIDREMTEMLNRAAMTRMLKEIEEEEKATAAARAKREKEETGTKPEPGRPGQVAGAEPEAPGGEEPPEEPKVDLEGLLADINRTLQEAPTPMESGLRIPQAMAGLLSKGREPEPPAEVEPTEPQDAEQATKDFLASINDILKKTTGKKKKEEKPEPPEGEGPPEGLPESPEELLTDIDRILEEKGTEPPVGVEPPEGPEDAVKATKDFLAEINTILKNPIPIKKKGDEPELPPGTGTTGMYFDPEPEERSRDIGDEMTAAFAGALASDLEIFRKKENLPNDLNAIEKRLSQRVAEIDAELARIQKLLNAGQPVDDQAAVALAKRRLILLMLHDYVETKQKEYKPPSYEGFDWDTERAEQRKVYEEVLDRAPNVDDFLMATLPLEQWQIQETIDTLESMVEVFEATNSPYLPTAKEYLDKLTGALLRDALEKQYTQ